MPCMRKIKVHLASACLLWLATAYTAQAGFKSAVITLEFPAGAVNCGMGETGVASAKNIFSMFWNPACLPALYDENFTNALYGQSHEKLLPDLELGDLYHDFNAGAIIGNKVLPYTDVAIGYYRNFINFGTNILNDSLGLPIDTFLSDETVHSISFAARAFDAVSFGVSCKYYDSRLAPGIGGAGRPADGVAAGTTVDIGLHLGKNFSIFDIIDFKPAYGISCLNLYNDSALYIHNDTTPADPIPASLRYGTSLGIGILDIFEYSYAYEIGRSLLKHEWDEVETHEGQRIQITPFYCMFSGKLGDTLGQRLEKSEGYAVTLNLQKTYRMLYRVVALGDKIFSASSRHNLDSLGLRMNIGGFTLLPNAFFQMARSEITSSEPWQVRKGQTQTDWSIGFGVLGSFLDAFRKQKPAQPQPARVPAPEDTNPSPAPPDTNGMIDDELYEQ